MIEKGYGSIIDCKAEALVNPVNCVGTMGKGLALEFKKAFPDNFYAYVDACAAKEMVMGKMGIYPLPTSTNPVYIINFPTKYHWKNTSSLVLIEKGLWALRDDVKRFKIKSIAIPALGCGLGQLEWDDISPLIHKIMGSLPDVQVIVFPPKGW